MAVKKKASKINSYDSMHKGLKVMTIDDIIETAQKEYQRPDGPRMDMLRRLAGRYNKLQGRRAMDLFTAKRPRDLRAALASNR